MITSPVCRWSIFSESPALALLEVMVNFDLAPGELPADYQLLEVDCSAVGVLSLTTNPANSGRIAVRSRRASAANGWLPAHPPC